MKEDIYLKGGFAHEHIKRIHEIFGKLPVIDSRVALWITPSAEDIALGIPGNPEQCALSRFCQREYGSNRALFFRTRACMDLYDKDGRKKIHRFNIPLATRKAIVKFDKKHIMPHRGFLLTPIPPYHRLENLRKRSLARKGATPKTTKTKRPVDSLTLQGVRTGQGMVKFRK